MKNKEKKDVKINVKKSMLSILFLIFVILSSSYLFQSCNSSIIDENNIDQIIDDLSKIDDESQIEYYSIDVVEKLSEELFVIEINNEDNPNIPNNLRFIEFNQDRMFGWVTLDGFEQNINNGLYYFELSDNSIIISNDDYSFITNIDFNNCWIQDSKECINLEINNDNYISQII